MEDYMEDDDVSAMRRLLPPIELDTPRGRAWAYLVIDYGPDHNLQWVTFLRDSGECWTFRNPEVRLAPVETMKIRMDQVMEGRERSREAESDMEAMRAHCAVMDAAHAAWVTEADGLQAALLRTQRESQATARVLSRLSQTVLDALSVEPRTTRGGKLTRRFQEALEAMDGMVIRDAEEETPAEPEVAAVG